MRFTSILVANRGEIAVRVIRTAKALGYRTIAVYSDADAEAPHVAMADEAVCIGPAPVAQSYLDPQKILDAAARTGAGAIHPGYGFLSENAGFARACEAAGLTFIGPRPDAVDIMGNKAEAKRRMIAAGVPCVPGYEGEDQADDTFIKAASEIGFPVMVKAVAGGGGRGMRLVDDTADLPEAIRLARSEAENAFGSGELILEKAIMRPRHVEVQVFADEAGNTIHLGERDCSVQRRHQKVIEEAPCPVMTDELRAKMGAAAVDAAKAISYRGAGTVEFLLGADGEFYFLEMNTRLQVEHPVTELITGLDLVALQIKVAQGEPLGLTQEDVTLSGHAIEVRLYAEDVAGGFLPSTGTVDLWLPPSGDGVRVDAGIATGLEVSPFYDPMIAKIMAHGPTRDVARQRLIEALRRTGLFGPKTNCDFLIDALGRPAFAQGEATTAFIDETYTADDLADAAPSPEITAAAAAIFYMLESNEAQARAFAVDDELMNWSSTGRLATVYRFGTPEAPEDVTVIAAGPDAYQVAIGDASHEVVLLDADPARCRLKVDGVTHDVIFDAPETGVLHISMADRTGLMRNLYAFAGAEDDSAGGGRILAPMHGLILEVHVREGQAVTKGETLAVLEAMKMQHQIRAEADGTVTSIRCTAGAQVPAGDVLVEIDVSTEEQ
ncbi:acetyl-CoA carboxylase biotin carboxylase subunit [Pyruvatibacter mobilis]|nr:acetyl/propionyl/methylcrotonyl-CoA carboxylase subunit alpha [Pyruvatibacter mobilis]GGD13600.1 geranyl-CoA carboxylase subunit alpha [Pyruvatibacter mobilis]